MQITHTFFSRVERFPKKNQPPAFCNGEETPGCPVTISLSLSLTLSLSLSLSPSLAAKIRKDAIFRDLPLFIFKENWCDPPL